MILFLFKFLVLPILIVLAVQWFFRKYGQRTTPPEIARLYERAPIEKGSFRVIVRRPGAEPELLGDFEKQPDAVDAAYAAREKAAAEGRSGAFLVLNDQGDALEEVDA